MKLKLVCMSSIIAIGCLILSGLASGQALDGSRLWIRAYGMTTSSMWFGNRIGNTTSGIDNQASFPVEYREQETPPPPLGFEAIWAPVRSAQFGSGIRGLLENQFNEWTAETQKDTFRINFVQGDDPDATIRFKWRSGAGLALRCDSAAIVFFDPDLGANVRINMADTDTLEIPQAGSRGVGFLRIYKYGSKLVDTDVRQESRQVPGAFSLGQNYPNPFNPTTTIRFDIQRASHVEISVYNVLGQKITTLFAGTRNPGTYSTEWNGTTGSGLPVSSGLYFVRMNATVDATAESFTALRKLLLLK